MVDAVDAVDAIDDLLELSASEVIFAATAPRTSPRFWLTLRNPQAQTVFYKLRSNCSDASAISQNGEEIRPGDAVDVAICAKKHLTALRACIMEERHKLKLTASLGARAQDWLLGITAHLPPAILPIISAAVVPVAPVAPVAQSAERA